MSELMKRTEDLAPESRRSGFGSRAPGLERYDSPRNRGEASHGYHHPRVTILLEATGCLDLGFRVLGLQLLV